MNYIIKSTVLIGQNDQMQQHRHELAVRNNKGGVSNGYPYSGLGDCNTSMVDTSYSYNGYYGIKKSYMRNIERRAGSETRSKNITVRYWKRTA